MLGSSRNSHRSATYMWVFTHTLTPQSSHSHTRKFVHICAHTHQCSHSPRLPACHTRVQGAHRTGAEADTYTVKQGASLVTQSSRNRLAQNSPRKQPDSREVTNPDSSPPFLGSNPHSDPYQPCNTHSDISDRLGDTSRPSQPPSSATPPTTHPHIS